ncbi:MAG: hypothetical protein ABIA74_06375 [bacterium]
MIKKLLFCLFLISLYSTNGYGVKTEEDLFLEQLKNFKQWENNSFCYSKDDENYPKLKDYCNLEVLLGYCKTELDYDLINLYSEKKSSDLWQTMQESNDTDSGFFTQTLINISNALPMIPLITDWDMEISWNQQSRDATIPYYYSKQKNIKMDAFKSSLALIKLNKENKDRLEVIKNTLADTINYHKLYNSHQAMEIHELAQKIENKLNKLLN